MLPRRPGPSSTTRGPPVSRTASPGRTPLVSSYTWMIVLSPTTWMTSPSSCASPTNWTSYIRGRRPVAVTTGPATRKISPGVLPAAAAFSFPFTAMLVSAPSRIESLVKVDPDCALDLCPEVFLFAFSDRDDHGTGSRFQSPPHRVAEGRHIVRTEYEDSDVRVFEDLRDLGLDGVAGDAEGLADARQLESLDEFVPAHGGEFHLHHQEVPDHVGLHRALLPPRDDSQVLDFPVLAHDIVEDRQDGKRMDVRVAPRLEQVELFDRAHELTNPERLQVLEAG